MSLLPKKTRTPCDKNYGVADAISLLDEYLGSNRDLGAAMARLTEDWKAQPKSDVLMPYLGLATKLSRSCPSLLVCPSVMTKAVVKLDEQHGPVNFSGVARGKWADSMSGKIRSMLSRWRRVHLEEDTKRKFLQSLSVVEKKGVKELLAIMGTFVEQDGEEAEGDQVAVSEGLASPSQVKVPSSEVVASSAEVVASVCRSGGFIFTSEGFIFKEGGFIFKEGGFSFKGDGFIFKGDGFIFKGGGFSFTSEGFIFKGGGFSFTSEGFICNSGVFIFKDDGFNFKEDGFIFNISNVFRNGFKVKALSIRGGFKIKS